MSLFKNALTYVLLARGVPIVYYGTEQAFSGGADPANREDLWHSNFSTQSDLYQWLGKVIGAKKSQGGLPDNDHSHLFVNDTAYAWARASGNIIALTSNIGSGNSRQYCFNTQKPNSSWKGVFDGNTYSSDGNGQLCATVSNGEPIVFTVQ